MRLISDKISRIILDLFYPNRCPCCFGFIRWNELVCEECIGELECMEDEGFCRICGRNPCICHSEDGLFYDEAYIFKPYLDKSRSGILSMKNGNNKNYGEYSGERLAEMLADVNADVIIPVPMSKRKQRSRGYNQAEIIALKISAKKNIPLVNDILSMRYSKAEQHTRSERERKFIRDYLDISDTKLSGMTVILCDDIITTGSTFNACAELLKKNGAEKVIIAAAAGTVYKV